MKPMKIILNLFVFSLVMAMAYSFAGDADIPQDIRDSSSDTSAVAANVCPCKFNEPYPAAQKGSIFCSIEFVSESPGSSMRVSLTTFPNGSPFENNGAEQWYAELPINGGEREGRRKCTKVDVTTSVLTQAQALSCTRDIMKAAAALGITCGDVKR